MLKLSTIINDQFNSLEWNFTTSDDFDKYCDLEVKS